MSFNRTIQSELNGRNNNFDIIRFLAATLVIYAHAFSLTGNAETGGILYKLFRFSGSGSFAVGIFLILSGFLVTMSYERTNNQRKYMRARLLRILPGLYVVILMSVFVLGPILTDLSLQEYVSDIGTYKYLLNLLLVPINFQNYELPGVFANNHLTAINGSLWTIPVEVYCYIFVMLIGTFKLLKSKRLIITCYFINVISYIVFPILGYTGIFYILSRCFMSFLLGMIVYIMRDRIVLDRKAAIFCLLGLILSYWLFYNYIITSLLSGYLIFYLGLSKRIKFYGFTKHGDFSYGIYIYAFPVQQTIALTLGSEMSPYMNFALSFIVTFLFAFASWHLIEKRFLKLK